MPPEPPDRAAEATPPAPGSAAWLEAALRARLGPGATLGTITFEGRLLRVEEATLPLGAGIVLRVAHAAVELGAGLSLGELPLALRLVAVRGELSGPGLSLPLDFTASGEGAPAWARGTLRAGPAGEIPGGVAFTGTVALDLVADGSLAEPRLHGRLSGAGVGVTGPGGSALAFDDFSLNLEADRRGLRYRDLAGSAGAARFRGWGQVPLVPPPPGAVGAPLLALQIERADAALLSGIAGARGPRLPPDLTASGEVSLSPARAVSGSFTVSTARSALQIRLAVDPRGALLGSTVRGPFGAADAFTLGLLRAPVVADGTSGLTLDARLTGTLSRPGLSGRVAATSIALAAGPALLEVQDASAILDAGPDGLAWQQLTARFYGGTITSSGRLGRGTGQLEAEVAFRGVIVEALPSGRSGENRLAALLSGTASGEARFERQGEATLSGRGRLVVERPFYPAVRRFAPTLGRYGLPPLSRQGAGPLTAEVRLAFGEIVVDPIRATLDGVDVEAELRVREAGKHLLGRARVHLREGYLSRSKLLSIPAALSDKVVIPIYVRGRVDALEVRTDAAEILDGLLQGSRAGGAVRSVLDSVLGARPGARRR